MPNKQNKRGRAKYHHSGPNFVQLFRYMLDCPAYVSLSLAARAALVEVKRGYNGSNNGRVVLSVGPPRSCRFRRRAGSALSARWRS